MEDKIALQGMMNMFNDGRQEAAEKCYEFIKQYFRNNCDDKNNEFISTFEDFLKTEFNIIIDPTALVCKYYDSDIKRCMSTKSFPYTDCKGYLSRCSQHPEIREKYNK